MTFATDPQPGLRTSSGSVLALPGQRWLDQVDDVDREVLARAVAPVLDLGCGPGRHTLALAESGAVVLGVDLSRHALGLARDRGLSVLERSVFDAIPKAGEWATALLLDGNIGIGSDPRRLLEHVASLLRPGGRLIVEVASSPDETHTSETVCFEIGGVPGPWFSWITVDMNSLKANLGESGLRTFGMWSSQDRSFVILEKCLV